MSVRDKQTPGQGGQDDTYEAAVLDFLDKEIAAVQTGKEKEEPSAELDALVSDLLKHVLEESDQSQESGRSGIEDADSPSLGTQLEEALAPESNLLENLDRELSQTISEQDLWDGEVQVTVETSLPAESEGVAAPTATPSEPVPSPAAPLEQDRAIVTHVEQEVRSQLFQPYPDEVFRPVPVQKRTMPFMAVAAALLVIVGGAIYYLTNSRDKAAKMPAAAAEAPTAVASIESDGIAPSAPKTEKKVARQSKAAPASSKSSVPASAAKAGEKTPPKQPSSASAEAPAIPKPAGDQKNGAEPALPVNAFNNGTAKLTVMPLETPEDQAVVTTNVPRVEVISAPLPSVEKAPPPEPTAAPAAAKAPERVEARPAEKSEGAPETVQTSGSAAPKTRVLVPAVPISQASPSYPELAVRSRSSGSVVLQLQIDDQGRVTKATPLSGPSMFHDAAVNAALKWRYRPASIDGLNVASQAKVTINFSFKR